MSNEKDRAAEVNNKAEEFTLSHAVMAMRAILEQENKGQKVALQKAKDELKKTDHSPVTDEEYEAKRKELFGYNRRPFIIVDYLNKLTPEGARTYLGNGYIEILLPNSLKNDIPKLRKLVGHELGHLALHFDELVATVGQKNGTKTIRELEKEAQADRFADELIRLRDEHLKNRFTIA